MEDVDNRLSTLPYELERVIFTKAAHRFPSSAKSFMLVAYRVHEWVGPIVNGVCNQLVWPYTPNTEKSVPSIHYFGQFVRHLIIGGDAEHSRVKLFLEACPNLIDLALWTTHPTKDFLPLFANLKLQRLCTNLSSLDENDFKGRYLSYITHLDVTVFSKEFERWKAFENLPALTHLAINEDVDRKTVQYLLDHCAKLRILLAIHDSDPLTYNLAYSGIQDPRFVMMGMIRLLVEDWEDGAKGKEDMWTCAEGISAAKRRGNFRSADFHTSFTRYHWREELAALKGNTY